ncbi:hypothetical protein NQ036_06820 [Brevibacterium sp. 91QC2O2]|uniref:hypothetical protein n=1 Tax=Brevibacterium sp. 91QC2O2 TaxID=2968458 RepID=UPI00211C5E1B|nr:hypothetical protein [Brevibacterium sp. 91QC2O2]MCQ9367956.1 hypothetical protein [Brevibacterium sp. 91QC2O2]
MLISVDALADYGQEIDPDDKRTMATATRMIKAATAAITSAAGAPILARESTVVVLGMDERILDLPGLPIRSASTVLMDGTPVTDWKLAASGLYRPAGWADASGAVTEVQVTYQHGLDEVPADIEALCASMVIAGILAAEDDGWELQNGSRSSIRIDDYQESNATSGEGVEQVTPMSLPERTRKWLASQFGGGARVLRTL